jgi:glycosyltransferase involved in cell wall biosynthesis
MYLAESRESVEIAKGDGINNVAWYPNNKRMNEALVAKRTKCRKFIYVGHVKPTKGLREIIIAGKQIPDDCLIDVYGPLLDGMSEADFIGVERVHYKGILSPFDVVRMMNEYDALLLPTYHGGEGYPGVILEAYAAGIPVVASRWQVIPELVDETSGILTEPKNATSLLEAMMILVNRQEHYIKLCHGVVLKRGEFDACKWLLEYINLCQEVLKKKRK